MNEKLVVGIADMKMCQNSGILISYALGSCIGVCLYDPFIKLAALLHILLPLNLEAGRKNPLKYADTGIRETVRQMALKGAKAERLTAKLAGGAKMFEVTGDGNLGHIGQRNIESVRIVLRQSGIALQKEDVGGSLARTVQFDAATGIVCVHSYARQDVVL